MQMAPTKSPRYFRRRSATNNASSTTPSAPPSSCATSTTAEMSNEQTQGQKWNEIHFPKFFEEAWGFSSESDKRTDLVRAAVFLTRFSNFFLSQSDRKELLNVVGDKTGVTKVADLAWNIMTKIFHSRHEDFYPGPLLQAVRFMLLKANMHTKLNERSRQLIDFFFDPTLHRNLKEPLKGEVVTYQYPSQGRLKVAIVGGGPTGLASAISLAEKGEGRIQVHVFERRWVTTRNATGDTVVGYPDSARRRDQVVTLQDSVTNLLSKASFEALFAGRPERVWPGSANIQIRKVEDRFLARCQSPELRGLIHLHAEGVTREELQAGKVGDFHVLLGTDGAASWVRGSYFHGYEKERGRSYALGLAFDRGAKGGLPWSQALNMFLTLGQTRYLLNASDHDGRGYLNMQLTEQEWEEMVAADGQPVHFGRPGCLLREDGSVPPGWDSNRVFRPSLNRDSALWKSISDGLKLFGFKESEVINVVRIPIVVQAVREGVHVLPPQDSKSVKRPHALVAVAGDAAMTVHFWPGRGLNSGIKAGIALGDEIMHALDRGEFIGLPLSAMKEYDSFLLKLQGREHDKRSIPILNQSGSPEMLGWLLSKSSTVPEEVALNWLVGAMTQIADRLEKRGDWYFPPEANVEAQIRIVLRQMHPQTLREMAVSFPWPTREMAGAEVLPLRSMKPEEKQKWLQQLWGLLSVERSKESAAAKSGSSSARFEAPRSPRRLAFGSSRSPSPSPSPTSRTAERQQPLPEVLMSTPSLKRSNALTTGRTGSVSGGSNLNGRPSGRRRFSNVPNLPIPCNVNHINSNNNSYLCDTSSPGLNGHTRGQSIDGATLEVPLIYRDDSRKRSHNVGPCNNHDSPSPVSPGYIVSPGYPPMSPGYPPPASPGYNTYTMPAPASPGYPSQMPVSPGFGPDPAVGLTRIMSIRKPNESVLADAMSLALFRVGDDELNPGGWI